MSHALIIADIEGITGIFSWDDIENDVKLYTQEIEVYIEALLRHGVNKITVCDSHNAGDLIDPKITKMGANIRLFSKMDSIPHDEKYDFALLVGFHGMSGSWGILSHSMRFDIKEVAIVDPKSGLHIPIGEVELTTRWLGSYDIPVILVTGDREAAYEANLFNPYRHTCCVKSLLQTDLYDISKLYDKLFYNLYCSLQLDKKLCLSPDDNEIVVKFHNPDITQALADKGYTKKDDQLLFKNCADLFNKLYPITSYLNELNKEIRNVNMAFLHEVRKLVKTLKKEDLAESDIGHLLKKNLFFLDAASREKIIEKIRALIG